MMNTIQKWQKSILLWTCKIMLILSAVVNAADNPRGEAFVDPAKRTDMPQSWIEKSIHYEDWAKNADLAVTLDQQLYPALLPVIKKYASEHQLDIAVQEGTCGISAKGLQDKSADIAGFCCPAAKIDRLPGVKFHTVGIAAIALFVHPDNPVKNITFAQAQQIFQGDVFRWSDIDKKAEGIIQVLGRLHCKQRPGHWRLLLDNEDLFSPRLLEVSTIADMISEAARDPNAMGYETLWMVNSLQDRGQVKILSIDGILPTDNQKLAKGDYPLYRTYNITTWETESIRNPKAQALTQYLMDYIDKLDIKKYGLVPVSKLRKAGWQFVDDEMIGEPKPKQ
jgi:ABC-type phosphate transport system substrate-binding protein